MVGFVVDPVSIFVYLGPFFDRCVVLGWTLLAFLAQDRRLRKGVNAYCGDSSLLVTLDSGCGAVAFGWCSTSKLRC